MQWFRTAHVFWQDGQTGTAAAKGGVIRYSDINPERSRDGAQQTFCLTQRLVEHQADRKGSFDRERRIERLTTPLDGSGCVPCSDRLFGEPNRQTASSNQPGIVLRPICHPVFGGWDLVAAAVVELVRHGYLRTDQRCATFPRRPGGFKPHGPQSAVVRAPTRRKVSHRRGVARYTYTVPSGWNDTATLRK